MAKLRLIFGICKIKSGNRVFSPEKDENVVVRKKKSGTRSVGAFPILCVATIIVFILRPLSMCRRQPLQILFRSR